MADVAELTRRRKESPNGAGHYHVADRYPYRVRALIDGVVVASSEAAMILKEVGASVYNPSFYFPAGDVELDHFQLEDGYTTRCPIKGDASYWHFTGPSGSIERAAWSYEEPVEYSQMIAGHVGFDQRFATLEISPVDPQ